ncbi:type III pantothenate kinase [Cytophaga aurantiaca]|uniref:type III pantothenate kinase n=1 Tax=Cytophaga aurantiaca TaxID=29530 RepID=UPI000364A446|nr:type III pantothenate kinase [Cytophaga aurantiaca]
MNIVLDVGNTYIKAGAFEGDTLCWTHVYSEMSEVILKVQETKPAHVFVSSVRKDKLFDALTASTNLLYFNSETVLPIKIDYKTPDTLGTDRIAAAVGATVLYPKQHNLIFDLGTCLTHGIVDQDHIYHGGSISPGLEMRLKALPHYTAKLPLVEIPSEKIELTGKSTTESILSGVICGMQFEIEGFVAAYQNKYPTINVLLTGGNSSLFEKRLKEAIFVVAELNLIGLNRILNYNV